MLPNTAFAHTIPSPFISSTDKTEYVIGETIKITGYVANEIIKPNQPVRIQIFSPDGAQYDDATVNLEQHGSYSNGFYNYGYTFSYDLKIRDGALAGNYQIMVYYDKSLWSSYTITYDKSHTNFNQYFVYNMYVNNKTYPIRYKLTEGNEIRGISSVDTGNNFFNIAVRGIENKTGQMTVELPRQMIDSKYDNLTDKNFTIAMGVSGAMIGYTNNFKEIQTNAENRILQFEIVPYDSDYLIFVYGTQSMNQNTIIQNNHTLSPLKQFKSGIKAEDVKCADGFTLVIKSEDHSPKCVKPDTAKILIEHGWALTRLNISGLQETYSVGEKIDFIIDYQGILRYCDHPDVSVLDSNQMIVWNSQDMYTACIPPPYSPFLSSVDQSFDLNYEYGSTISMNKTGNYIMKVSLHGSNIERGFSVK